MINNEIKSSSNQFSVFVERFLQLEEKLDLFNKRIDGVYFWERIRFRVQREILESSGVFGQSHTIPERSTIKNALFALRAFFNLFSKSPFFAKPSKVLFIGSPRRKLLKDGKWWDVYCDFVIEQLPENEYTYLELPYLDRHFTSAKTKNLKYLDFILFITTLMSKLGLISVVFTGEEQELLESIKKQIKEYFNVDVKLKEIVYKDLQKRKSRLALYKFIIRNINPEIVVLVCSYGKETFIEICKELQIPTVELQHGVINKYHLGYSFPGIKRKKRTFPDYFFAFGDFWKDCVEFPIQKEHIFSVGFPYLEEEAYQYQDVPKKQQILFISQGNVGKVLSKFAVDLSKYKNLDYSIVYKLHPGEYHRWKREYPWLTQTNIKVVGNDDIPLYRLMAESKIQVGVNSTAIYEGLNFNLETYLLDFPGVEYMDYLVQNGYAERVTSVADLIQKIQGARFNQKTIHLEKFFKKNSVKNILNALNRICESKI